MSKQCLFERLGGSVVEQATTYAAVAMPHLLCVFTCHSPSALLPRSNKAVKGQKKSLFYLDGNSIFSLLCDNPNVSFDLNLNNYVIMQICTFLCHQCLVLNAKSEPLLSSEHMFPSLIRVGCLLDKSVASDIWQQH